MYEKMYNAAKSNDSDIVFCNCIENENDHKFTPEMCTGAYDREKIKTAILQLEELAAECEKSGLAIVADRIRKIICTLKD